MRLFFATTLLAALGSPAHAADPIPLDRGLYIDAAEPCSSLMSSVQVRYDGVGFQTPHVGGGHISNVRKSGDSYTFQETMTSENGQPISQTMTQTVVVKGRRAFNFKTPYGASDYRWCAP